MSTPTVDGVDRALSRYRRIAHTTIILRHQRDSTMQTPAPRADRLPPDRYQVIGIPLFIMRTPPLRRLPIDEPRRCG